ncbi:nucleolin-like isoform X2 [Liolophura sinensis]|uniref:nucleolin-like isoform X2 n=1 Tax=Liolophura sinensis TaxID=3198878 RepID=UPI0031584838
MPKGAAQARKKKTKPEPAEQAPAAEEVKEEVEDVGNGDQVETEEGMEVSLEPTEGEEDLPEPGDDILDDDNNNDGEEAADEQAEDELLEEEGDEEVEGEEVEEEEEEEGVECGEEAEEEVTEGENGETKKRKATGKQPVAKKQKVEPKPVRMNVYVKRVTHDSFESSLETFLKENEVALKEFRPNIDPAWTLAGEIVLMKPEDKEKTLNLSGSELDLKEVKFETIEEKETNEGDESLKKLRAPDEVILFVRNFLKTTTEEDLRTLFPTVVELHVPQKNQKSKGFAFLQFGSKEEVQEIIKTKQGVELAGKKLVLSQFSSRSSGDAKSPGRAQRVPKTKDQVGNSQNRVLFVGNLSFDTKEDKIMRIFRTAESVKILRFANTGKSKGVAFIEFRTPLAARKAFEKFSNAKIDGRSINLEYADQDKFKGGERVPAGRGTQGRDPGRRMSGGGGRSMQGYNAGGRQFRDGGQIRSLLDNMQFERSMELESRYNRMGNMDGGMGGRMGMGMGLDSGLGMGMDRGLGSRMNLDSSLGLDSGFGGRMGLDSGLSARMSLDGGMGGRMSLDGGLSRRMGLDGGFGMGDRLGMDSGFGGRMSMDGGMGSYGGRMGGMDSGSFGGGYKNRGMGGMRDNSRMRQGNRKGWN